MPLATAALCACGAPPSSPEQEIRSLVAEAVRAAEERDIGAVKELISERYADEQGRDKRAVGATIGFYLLRHHAVHVLTRVGDMTFPRAGRAQATVLAALAGDAIASVDSLAGMRADLYRFELRLAREDGDWRVTFASWRPATLGEFF
ncbi:MAG: hypothetical protein JSU66_15875 [Deltaproteobacteria bacterium]|nr:MAG: hypothetical protein JSU66_15875 [Deltaproteobacteria bacterium]